MGKKQKLIARFKSKPNDFSWQELEHLLTGLGYELLNCGLTSGSRVKFVHSKYPAIFLHKPHPGKILKKYQVNDIYNALVTENLI